MKTLTGTRICQSLHCRHEKKEIQISQDKYICKGGAYYHEDCFADKQNIQAIKDLWKSHISRTVVINQLYAILNHLIFVDNVPSDFLLFIVRYCIKNKCKLRYPAGLKYYVDNVKLQSAYKKERCKGIRQTDFRASTEPPVSEPTFEMRKGNVGFTRILGG